MASKKSITIHVHLNQSATVTGFHVLAELRRQRLEAGGHQTNSVYNYIRTAPSCTGGILYVWRISVRASTGDHSVARAWEKSVYLLSVNLTFVSFTTSQLPSNYDELSHKNSPGFKKIPAREAASADDITVNGRGTISPKAARSNNVDSACGV